MPKIGDIKKDKLKNSLAMTNEEKEKAVAREVEISRNRGTCMVSNCVLGVSGVERSWPMVYGVGVGEDDAVS